MSTLSWGRRLGRVLGSLIVLGISVCAAPMVPDWPVDPATRHFDRNLVLTQIEIDALAAVSMSAEERIRYQQSKLALSRTWFLALARVSTVTIDQSESPPIDVLFESLRWPIVPDGVEPASRDGVSPTADLVGYPSRPAWWQTFGQSVAGISLDDLTVSGLKTIEISARSGATDLARTETLQLNIAGQAAGATVNVSIDQNSLGDESSNKTQVMIQHPNGQAMMGQFQTQFAHLDLLRYTGQVDGVQSEFQVGALGVGGLYSTTRGGRAKQQFTGNNSQGPFVAADRPILVGSEVVDLNGVRLQRDIDYQIDYGAGTLRLLTRIATPDDRLTWYYESEAESNQTVISGLKGRYVLDPTKALGITYMQRRERRYDTDQPVTSVTDMTIADIDWVQPSMSAHAEVAHTRVDAGQSIGSGAAISVRGSHAGALASVSGYGMMADSGFTSIDAAGVSPGDYKFGGSGTIQLGPTRATAATDLRRQTLSDHPQIDRDTSVSVANQWGWGTTQLSGQWLSNLETTSDNAVISMRTRQITAASTKLPVGWGQLQAALSQEDHGSNTVTTADAYIARQLDATYTVSDSQVWDLSMGASLRQSTHSRVSRTESKTRISGSLKPSRSTTVTGVGEYRGFSDGDPVTFLQLTGDTRQTNFSIDGNLALESLKERVGSQLVDMSQWDIGVRTAVDPLSGLRLKSSWRLTGKWPQFDGPPVFYNQEWSGDLTATPLSWLSLSIQNRQTGNQRGVLGKDGSASYIESMDDGSTWIFRGLTHWGNTSFSSQYEMDNRHQHRVTPTQPMTQQVTTAMTRRLLNGLSQQVGAFGLGWELEWRQTESVSPTVSISNRHLTTGVVQWRPLDWLTLKATLGVSDTQDIESFRSVRHGGEIVVRWVWGNAVLSYDRTDDFRASSHPWTADWRFESRITVHDQLSTILTINRETGSDRSRWIATGRMSVTI